MTTKKLRERREAEIISLAHKYFGTELFSDEQLKDAADEEAAKYAHDPALAKMVRNSARRGLKSIQQRRAAQQYARENHP